MAKFRLLWRPTHTGSDDREDNAWHAGKFIDRDYKFKMAI